MRYAMVDRNGLVVHVLEGNPDDPPTFENYRLYPSETANIGDQFDGKNFAPATGRPPPLSFRLR